MKKNLSHNTPLLAGIKPVLELLQSNPERISNLFIKKGLRNQECSQMLDLCRMYDIRFSFVDTITLDRMCSAQHQGIIARLSPTTNTPLGELLQKAMHSPLPIIVALDQVQDPGNVGTLARTIYGLGAAGLILPKHNSAYLGDVAKKAAAGALEHLSISQVTNLGHALDEAEEAGFYLLGTGISTPENTVNALTQELPLPCVLILGNEGKGMRPNITKRCHKLAYIPMQNNFDSLNVAQATAILLGLMARQCAIQSPTMQNYKNL